MQLGGCKVGNEWSDKHSRFSLADEGRGCCYDCFSPRDTHRVEEERGEFLDGPLEDAPVEEELDDGDEEDDGRNDIDEEVAELENVFVAEEDRAFRGESEEGLRKICYKVEDIILWNFD